MTNCYVILLKIENPAEIHAQIVSDFIGPEVLFSDIERRDVDESMELFGSQNNHRLTEKTRTVKMGLNKHMQILTLCTCKFNFRILN